MRYTSYCIKTFKASKQSTMDKFYNNAYGNKAIAANRTTERKLSNKAKSIVIHTVIQPMITSDTWINDFSCGKMQDFNKWQTALTPKWHPSDNRTKLIGSDISSKGIEEGNRRIHQAGLTRWFKSFECDLFSSKLDPEHHLTKMLELNKDRHNVLSMQLAAHYAFESPEKFDNLIHNMLISGPSILFLTIPDPGRIIDPNLNLENASVSNVEVSGTPFGNKYVYQQSGTCISEPIAEYICDEDLLTSTLNQKGFKLIFDKNHSELVNVAQTSPVSFYKSLVYIKNTME